MRLVVWLVALFVCAVSVTAQDSKEALGPSAGGGPARGPHPLDVLMKEKQPRLMPALRGVHPRVYVTDAEIADLRTRSRGTHRALWAKALEGLNGVLRRDPPAPPAIERRVQNGVGIAIAGLALAYKVDQKPEYLAAAKKYMDAAVSYDVWGYPSNKPNVDLAAGHLLYGLGWGYDLLYQDLTAAEREKYRAKLVKQARILAEYFRPKSGKVYSYSQNHVFIPISGLAVTAYALFDEVAEAPEWAAMSRAIFDRVLATYSADGYYYEGFEYWVFSTPWMVHYLDAHLHATGEDLYDRPGLRNTHLFVAHSVLPDGKNIFDFGDAFEGAETRSGRAADAARTHPGGKLHSNYNLIYRFAQKFRDPAAQGVAQWLASNGQVNAEDFWSLLWFDASLAPVEIAKQPAWHYFRDHDVVYWRTAWTSDAMAIAVKSGPPEGHQSAALAKKYPDWRQEAGHAHPDAGSFILWARGEYLSGDTGYSGVPKSANHNTLLVDGRGQEAPGAAHNAFLKVPLEGLDAIRLSDVRLESRRGSLRADFGAAYPPELGVKSAVRTMEWDASGRVSVRDALETERDAVVTALVHSDVAVRRSGAAFELGNRLRLTIADGQKFQATVEPNEAIGAGPPGAVDKGPKEQRGWRVAVTEKTPATAHAVAITLEVK